MSKAKLLCSLLLLVGGAWSQDFSSLDKELLSLKKNFSEQTLSPSDISSLLQGTPPIGLHLVDNFKLPNSVGVNCTERTGTSGFSLDLISPKAWIARKRYEAERLYKKLEPEEIQEVDKLPVLRVIIKPDLPFCIIANGMQGASSVDHVVIRSVDKKQTIRPLLKKTFDTKVQNAFGGGITYHGLIAVFDLKELAAVRSNSNGEFLITVIGDYRREFKVKKKHFYDLALPLN